MTHDARDRECAKPMSSALQKNGAAAPEPAPKNFKFGYLVHDVSRMRRTVMDQAMRPATRTHMFADGDVLFDCDLRCKRDG